VLVTGDRSFANVSAYVQSEVKVTANVTPTTKPTVPESQPGISLISKKSGVNYTRLRDLLAGGKWQEADQETNKAIGILVTEVVRAREDGVGSRIARDSDYDIPCEDLRTINQLWLHYSNGKFGFSVQKKIYESLGGTRNWNDKVWREFKYRVGWRKGGRYLSYSDLTFNVELAPKGHLPSLASHGNAPGVNVYKWIPLLSRAKTCKL
jgi:hypothetical protein